MRIRGLTGPRGGTSLAALVLIVSGVAGCGDGSGESPPPPNDPSVSRPGAAEPISTTPGGGHGQPPPDDPGGGDPGISPVKPPPSDTGPQGNPGPRITGSFPGEPTLDPCGTPPVGLPTDDPDCTPTPETTPVEIPPEAEPSSSLDDGF
ncbi:hypothetical protein [Streptomyces tsukubensis]|uniref:Lipoprotein n=1 Tax=Streptomyces tsukubensis TaxID=83656 RepID=A0A1V4A1S9_9ACTN|nr:hypothetical protein [Streptomyces tsukubensis]OON72913.1 hypothetical protein B1H18_28305 [Streptomyces tsukubensis]QFR94485.1 hypothetical protein GBW32_17325 [Streptomyces tsukubensis]